MWILIMLPTGGHHWGLSYASIDSLHYRPGPPALGDYVCPIREFDDEMSKPISMFVTVRMPTNPHQTICGSCVKGGVHPRTTPNM